MGGKVILKIVSTVVVNIILLVLYVWLFGVQCIKKYLGDGVIIINHKERPLVINPPGTQVFKNIYIMFSIISF